MCAGYWAGASRSGARPRLRRSCVAAFALALVGPMVMPPIGWSQATWAPTAAPAAAVDPTAGNSPASLADPPVPALPASATAANANDPGAAGATVSSSSPATNPPASPDALIRRTDPGASTDSNTAPSGSDTVGPTDGLDLPRVVVALGAVIAIILLLRSLLQGLTGKRPIAKANPLVKVIGRCPIASRQQVVLLKVGRRIVVVGDAGSQLSPLAQITDPDEVAALLGQIQASTGRMAKSVFSGWFSKAQEVFPSTDQDEDEPRAMGEDDESEAMRSIAALPSSPKPEPRRNTSPDEEEVVADMQADLSSLSERVRGLRQQWGGQ